MSHHRNDLCKGEIPKPYQCEHCDMKFVSKRGVDRHINKNHSGERTSTTCEVCGHISSTIRTHLMHMHVHNFTKHEDGRFECKECGEILEPDAKLKKHKHLKCDVCPFQCKRQEYLDKHKNLKHGIPLTNGREIRRYLCDKCDFVCFNSAGLRKHQEHVHEDKTEKCQICGKDVKSLYLHMRGVHAEEGIYQKCHLCQKSIKAARFKDHMEKKHQHNLCTICNKFFSCKSKLIEHFFYA